MVIADAMNAGRSSYMPQTSPIGCKAYFHTNTIIPPTIIPQTAPCSVVRFQKRLQSITGPNAAPKPAQANETILKMELSGFHARTIAIAATARIVSRAKSMDVLGDTLMWSTS